MRIALSASDRAGEFEEVSAISSAAAAAASLAASTAGNGGVTEAAYCSLSRKESSIVCAIWARNP